MAYRKGDIPKVKLDIPNAPKFDLGDLTEPMSNMDRLFDNIAKDIRERQDNAIAMEFTKCIGELLKKNGVTPKITKYTHENVKEHSIEQLYGVSIDELDFSEHDKVFENEIAGLKAKIAIKDMDYKTASELLGKYQRENEALKKKNIELENFSCQAEQETESLFAELKQRIAELEDKIGDRDEINRCLREQIEELQKKNENLTEEYKVMSDFANKQMQKCEKLESRETENTVEVRVPDSPIEIATYLINNTCTINELKMIAEHINVYCNGGK